MSGRNFGEQPFQDVSVKLACRRLGGSSCCESWLEDALPRPSACVSARAERDRSRSWIRQHDEPLAHTSPVAPSRRRRAGGRPRDTPQRGRRAHRESKGKGPVGAHAVYFPSGTVIFSTQPPLGGSVPPGTGQRRRGTLRAGYVGRNTVPDGKYGASAWAKGPQITVPDGKNGAGWVRGYRTGGEKIPYP